MPQAPGHGSGQSTGRGPGTDSGQTGPAGPGLLINEVLGREAGLPGEREEVTQASPRARWPGRRALQRQLRREPLSGRGARLPNYGLARSRTTVTPAQGLLGWGAVVRPATRTAPCLVAGRAWGRGCRDPVWQALRAPLGRKPSGPLTESLHHFIKLLLTFLGVTLVTKTIWGPGVQFYDSVCVSRHPPEPQLLLPPSTWPLCPSLSWALR